jgi:hypothetical protein
MTALESYQQRSFRFALAILGFYRSRSPVLAQATEPLIDEDDRLIAILTTTIRKLRSTDRSPNKTSAQ